MSTSVKMPRLGESVAEGTIGAWLKNEGDLVEKDEALAEIITDKINAELPSPIAGRLAKILVGVDETVPVGIDIAVIEESADVPSVPSTSPLYTAHPAHPAHPVHPVPGPDAAPVSSVAQAATQIVTAREAYTHSAARTNGSAESVGSMGSIVTTEEEERQRISPLARRLAREHGINLSEIIGTGAGGRVRKEDILAYVERRQTTANAAPPPPSLATQPAPQGERSAQPPLSISEAGPEEELIAPSRMRLAIAEHMVRSKRTSPHATTVVEIDMTAITKWLAQHKEEFKQREGYSISYVPFVMKAVCEGIRKFPIINSTWTVDNKIIIKKRINLGMAVATDDGLVVPTIYDADQYTIAGLARQVHALAQRARMNKLTIQDMQNSTFVVNNPGVFGTIISMPIINQPHAGIVSMDAVVKRPVVIEDDAIAVRSMMYMSLSFDHRILDGAGAGGFLQAVRSKLQGYGREIDIY